MTNPYIILLSGELRVFDMPVKPRFCQLFTGRSCTKQSMCGCAIMQGEYNQAYENVIKNAIKVENPEAVGTIQKYPDDESTGLFFFNDPATIKQNLMEENEPVPLPKGLKVEIKTIDNPEQYLTYAVDGSAIPSGVVEIARLIKEPVNTEPFSESKLHETFDGPEITEGEEPSIKLTFYSGKLWHSDKPFPTGLQLPSFNEHASLIRGWLSTAYEVVNPEVIPGIRKARKLVKLNPCYGFENLNDGDQITLPDGYGIKNNLQWHPVGCEGKWQNTNEYYFDTVQFPCGKRRAATITLPEKTENSDHWQHCGGLNCPAFEYACADVCMRPIIKEPVSEPSESQEELAEEIVNVIWNLGDTTSLLHCKNYIKEHYILTRRK